MRCSKGATKAICHFKNKSEQRKAAKSNERQMETRPKNEQQKAANNYTDDIIILLNFIFTSIHGYQITQGLSTNKQRHRLLLLKGGGGGGEYMLHQPIFA